MTLEDSNGRVREPVDDRMIDDAVGRLGRGEFEHLILAEGTRFIQAAGGPEGLLLEYNDGGTHFTSATAGLPEELITRALKGFLHNQPGWNAVTSFNPAGGGLAGGSPERKPASHTIKETLTSAARNEAAYGARRLIRRVIRSVFR